MTTTTWHCERCGTPEGETAGRTYQHYATACQHMYDDLGHVHDLGETPTAPDSVAIQRTDVDGVSVWWCGDPWCPRLEMCAHCWSRGVLDQAGSA